MAHLFLYLVFLPNVGFYFSVAAHELGHALCAKLAGFQIREFRIGGPPHLLFWAGATRVKIGFVVKPSIVRTYAILPMRKGPWLLLCAGGWIGNLTAIGLLSLVASMDLFGADGRVICVAMIALQAWTIVVTVWPYRARIDQRDVPSDGSSFLTMLRFSAEQAAQFDRIHLAWLRQYWDGRGPEPGPSAALDRIVTLTSEARNPNPANRAELLEDLAREFARSLHPAERLWLLEAAVAMLIREGRAEDNDLLDAWSAEALALRPDMPTLKGSRGAALIQLGRCDEAKAMLAEAGYDDPFNAMLSHAFLAQAEFRLGNPEAAGRHIEAAYAASAGNVLLRNDVWWDHVKRISNEIGRRPPPTVDA